MEDTMSISAASMQCTRQYIRKCMHKTVRNRASCALRHPALRQKFHLVCARGREATLVDQIALSWRELGVLFANKPLAAVVVSEVSLEEGQRMIFLVCLHIAHLFQKPPVRVAQSRTPAQQCEALTMRQRRLFRSLRLAS